MDFYLKIIIKLICYNCIKNQLHNFTLILTMSYSVSFEDGRFDIYDEKFNIIAFGYENIPIQILYDQYGKFWLNGENIAYILGYKNTSESIKQHVDRDNICTVSNFNGSIPKIDSLKPLKSETKLIDELGFYQLIYSKKSAESYFFFKEWVIKQYINKIKEKKELKFKTKLYEKYKKIVETKVYKINYLKKLCKKNGNKPNEILNYSSKAITKMKSSIDKFSIINGNKILYTDVQNIILDYLYQLYHVNKMGKIIFDKLKNNPECQRYENECDHCYTITSPLITYNEDECYEYGPREFSICKICGNFSHVENFYGWTITEKLSKRIICKCYN